MCMICIVCRVERKSYDAVLMCLKRVLSQELIGKMLQVNAEARYTAQDILCHPWVTVSHSAVTSLYLHAPYM